MTVSFPFERKYNPPYVHVIDKQVSHSSYHEVCRTVGGHVFEVYVGAPIRGDRGSGGGQVLHWWDGQWHDCYRLWLFGRSFATPELEGHEGEVHEEIFEYDRNRLLTVAAEIVGADFGPR